GPYTGPLCQYEVQRSHRTRMLRCLRSLLDHLRRNPDRTCSHLSSTGGNHVLYRLGRPLPCASFGIRPVTTDIFTEQSQPRLDFLISYEEERSTRSRADDGRSDAGIDASESARRIETGRGLKTGLECVNGV
ncbi:MAG: hypothetical protein Q9198_010239, partial [Flavoplaca austrocitrina]